MKSIYFLNKVSVFCGLVLFAMCSGSQLAFSSEGFCPGPKVISSSSTTNCGGDTDCSGTIDDTGAVSVCHGNQTSSDAGLNWNDDCADYCAPACYASTVMNPQAPRLTQSSSSCSGGYQTVTLTKVCACLPGVDPF